VRNGKSKVVATHGGVEEAMTFDPNDVPHAQAADLEMGVLYRSGIKSA